MTAAIINAEGVDDHHVFPQSYLKDQGVTGVAIDCVLNRTLIDADTNRRIGKRAPSSYMTEIADVLEGASSASLNDLMASHLLPGPDAAQGTPNPLLVDDFVGYLDTREALLIDAIEQATGHAVGISTLAGGNQPE